jgi:hypothetical protein
MSGEAVVGIKRRAPFNYSGIKRAYFSDRFREPDKENCGEFGFQECSRKVAILRSIRPIFVVEVARVPARRCLGPSCDRPRDALRYLSRASDPGVRCQRTKLLPRVLDVDPCLWRLAANAEKPVSVEGGGGCVQGSER